MHDYFNTAIKNEAPSIQLIKKWAQNFKETGSTINQPLSGRPRISRDLKNVERVRASFSGTTWILYSRAV